MLRSVECGVVEHYQSKVSTFDISILIIIQDCKLFKNLSAKEPIDCPNCFFKRHL